MTDRELDILVAEKVFGWTRLSADEAYEWTMSQPAPPPVQMAHRAVAWVHDGHMRACEACGTMPMFSTDPAACKQVREKLAERFNSWELEGVFYSPTEDNLPCWMFRVDRMVSDDDGWHSAVAKKEQGLKGGRCDCEAV